VSVWLIGLFMCLSLIITGCDGKSDEEALPVSPLPTEVPSKEAPVYPLSPMLPPAPTLPAVSTPPPEPEGAVARAVADLARRLEIAPEEIEIVTVFYDAFPAQGLGCPLPDRPVKSTAPDRPALVTGQVIQLRVADEVYVYHARGTQVVFCEQGGQTPKLPEATSPSS